MPSHPDRVRRNYEPDEASDGRWAVFGITPYDLIILAAACVIVYKLAVEYHW